MHQARTGDDTIFRTPSRAWSNYRARTGRSGFFVLADWRPAGGLGIPKDVSYLPGLDACRKIVLSGSCLLTSPTSVLCARTSSVRGIIFALGRYHEDTEAACGSARAASVSFASPVSLRADVSITTSVLAFNSYDLDISSFSSAMAPGVDGGELARQRTFRTATKRFLGRALLRLRPALLALLPHWAGGDRLGYVGATSSCRQPGVGSVGVSPRSTVNSRHGCPSAARAAPAQSAELNSRPRASRMKHVFRAGPWKMSTPRGAGQTQQSPSEAEP